MSTQAMAQRSKQSEYHVWSFPWNVQYPCLCFALDVANQSQPNRMLCVNCSISLSTARWLKPQKGALVDGPLASKLRWISGSDSLAS